MGIQLYYVGSEQCVRDNKGRSFATLRTFATYATQEKCHQKFCNKYPVSSGM